VKENAAAQDLLLDGLRSGLSPHRPLGVLMRCRRLQLLAVRLS
jgi:hypothetical protein